MEEIVWADNALDDLRSIYSYIAEDSLFYAERLVNEIFDRVSFLPLHPQIGRVVPEKNDIDIREVIEGNYRIVYSTAQLPRIIVYRILHHSRLFRD